MAESKLTQDLAEFAEQCLDREEEEELALFRLDAEAARRFEPILVEFTEVEVEEAAEERS